MSSKILIADDSRFSRKLIQGIVESIGHEVIGSVGDGAQALKAFVEKSPDIVLLDVTMPNMSGKECLAEILKAKPEAKVIMISALTNPSLEQECLTLGARSFLSKAMNETPEAFREALASSIAKIAA